MQVNSAATRGLWRRCLVIFTAILACDVSFADTVVGIVSERNAAEIAAAAHAVANRHSPHRFVLRTTAQIDAMSDAEVRALLNQGDAILLATVFRDTALRLQPLTRDARAPTVVALAGDAALGRSSRWTGRPLFAANDARYEALSSLTTEQEATRRAIDARVAQYPDLAPWIRARGYWQNRNAGNLEALLMLMLSPSAVCYVVTFTHRSEAVRGPGHFLGPCPPHSQRIELVVTRPTYEQIPQTYDQWRYCITVECRIELTAAFVAQRLNVLRNSQTEESQRFRRCYGDDHWRSVLAWFERTERELGPAS